MAAGCLVLILAGCAANRASQSKMVWLYPHAGGATLTQSSREHRQAISIVSDRDSHALIEDLGLLFMTDRPTRLTRWQTR